MFNEVFRQPANAAALVRSMLPAEMVDHLDLATISVELITVADEEGENPCSILVYSTRCRDSEDILHIIVRLME